MANLSSSIQEVEGALLEFKNTKETFKPVAEYCRDAYTAPGSNRPKVYQETVNYTRDILGHVAYNTHNVAEKLTMLLDAQADELDRLDVKLKAASQSMAILHQSTGTNALRTEHAAAVLPETEKSEKLPDTAIPEHALPLTEWQRPGPIDYSNYATLAGQYEEPLSVGQLSYGDR